MNRVRRSGMTLVEVLVATFLLAIFGLAASSSLTLAMRQWQQVGRKVNAIQNARFVAGTIVNELRTAVPCPVPTMGWASLAGVNQPTGVHMPNQATTNSTTLTFMQPNSAVWNPISAAWSPTQTTNYRRVTYTAANGSVNRESFNYPSGSPISAGAEPIATGENITTSYQSLAFNVVNVTITAQEGPYVATYQANCLVIGR